MHSIPTRAVLVATIAISLLALVLAPRPAVAASYWWTGAPAAGSNGFSFSTADQPWWNPWHGHGRCETRGATIPAGNPCILAWHVPAHLDARGGSISGTYKHANPAFEQRNTVECNGTTTLRGTSTIQTFNRAWPDMCSYLSIAVLTPTQSATVSAASQFFDATAFSVELVDSHPPVVELVDGHAGWKGAAGACIRYVLSELGSGLQDASLLNVTTGQVLDAPSWATSAIVTGVGRSDRTPCLAPPGTGTFTIRAAVTDKSGNHARHDVLVSFDVTPPALGVPQADGTELADGRRFHGSADEYRPTFTVAASDAHSGLASVQVLLDGVVVAGGTSWRPPSNLAIGSHVVAFRATDHVGNVAMASRTFTVVDDVPPTILVQSPDPSGGTEPVLDVTADDDHVGLEPTTWSVRVNGQLLVAGSSTRRLQAGIGLLVDGAHRLEVQVADRAGNVATLPIGYVADSGDGLPDPPADGGLFLVQSPAHVEEGTVHRILAIASRYGRPVSGHYELRNGDQLVASVEASRYGVVDLQARIDVAGPLQLHAPAGSGIDPVTMTYAFVPAPVDPCIAQPLGAGCSGSSGDGVMPGGSSTTMIIQLQQPASADGAAGATGGGATNVPGSPWPVDVVYYVNGVPYWNGLPLAESGAPLDRVPPVWRMSLLHERSGTVRRTGRIALRLWTNEMSVLSISPHGSPRRISVNPRRKLRTIHVRYDRRSPLGRRIARARRGSVVVVRMRVVATDRNENATAPRTLTLRVRV
jgi:hypothetical protein